MSLLKFLEKHTEKENVNHESEMDLSNPRSLSRRTFLKGALATAPLLNASVWVGGKLAAEITQRRNTMTTPTNNPDVVLVGAGIMKRYLGSDVKRTRSQHEN
jgi:hypothetical protein